MSALAPIVLFCYNRPQHTEQTLRALSENVLADQSELFVFCDGPKVDATEEQKNKIAEVRKVVRSKNWCGKVTVIESPENKGLANSVIAGVTKIVNEFGRVIVLEDDLITSKYFLEYMNTALEKYKEEEKVMQVSGHQFPVGKWDRNKEAFFMPYATSWGWATWIRAWNLFDVECKGYEKMKSDADLRFRFNLNGGYPYYEMLLAQMIHKSVDSWAIRWWWNVFVQNGLTLFPDFPLVENIGFGEFSTHTSTSLYEKSGFNPAYKIETFPSNCKSATERFDFVCAYFKNMNLVKETKTIQKKSFIRRVIDFIQK